LSKKEAVYFSSIDTEKFTASLRTVCSDVDSILGQPHPVKLSAYINVDKIIMDQKIMVLPMDYLFNAWGGLPRILMERGKIIQTVSDELFYAIATNVPAMPAEQVEYAQMRRCVAFSSGMLCWEDGVVFRETNIWR